MAAIDRFILLVRDLRRNERGIAVPTALMALIASFAFASVAVVSTVHVQQGSNRDHNSKEAIAAADAGANIALLRLNRFLPSLSVANPCVGPSGEAQAASSGWCPNSPTESVGSATYSYRISALTASGELNIISVGSSGNVSRRVNVTLKTVSGQNIFAEEKMIGEEKIEFSGSAPRINTDIGTNGDITSNANPTICGDERHGVGKKADPNPTCEGVKLEGERTLPPIVPPANIATVNSNCRLDDTCANGEEDTVSKKNALSWSSSTRVLDVGSQGTLTMSGSDYFVCKLILHPGTIFVPIGRHVRIFVDTPEHCKLPSGTTQVEMTGNSNFQSTGFNPAQGFFEVPGIYVLGNGGVVLGGNSGSNEMMLYAPNSSAEIYGNASWNGMFAAKSINIHGSVTIESDSRIKPPEITLASIFQRTRYVECIGATATPPNADC